jgi:outer membrane lipoprotein LolB
LRKLFILIALMATLPGCALFRSEGVVQAPMLSAAKQSLYALKTWRMEGRIGVQTAEDAWQANLFWEHDPHQDRLRVSGPLSQGMISIVLQKDLIYIDEGDGATQLSRDPDALLRDRLGFAVPLSSLRYWILGVPDSGQAYTPVYGGDGALSGFRQAGWAIRMDRFMNVGNHVVPQKMQVQGSGVKLKIIADTWDIKG